MACYVIVTCRSFLWTLLTVVTALSTIYCLSSAHWLYGYERPYFTGIRDVENTSVSVVATRDERTYSFIQSTHKSTYRPAIGLFNRCIRTISEGVSIESCASFADLFGGDNDSFPLAWQGGLVLMGIASILLAFVMICSALSLCVRDFCKKSLFTICGLIQVIAGVLLAVAEAIYPIGWSAGKVQYYCGENSKAYILGDCDIGWAYIAVIASTVCVFATGMLSIQADRATSKDEIEDEILEGKRLICVT